MTQKLKIQGLKTYLTLNCSNMKWVSSKTPKPFFYTNNTKKIGKS